MPWVLPDRSLSFTHASTRVRSSELVKAKASTSKMHMQVSRVLSDMGVQHTNDTETGGLSVETYAGPWGRDAFCVCTVPQRQQVQAVVPEPQQHLCCALRVVLGPQVLPAFRRDFRNTLRQDCSLQLNEDQLAMCLALWAEHGRRMVPSYRTGYSSDPHAVIDLCDNLRRGAPRIRCRSPCIVDMIDIFVSR